jgi:hypothetical protein
MEASERAGCPRKLLSIPSDLFQEYASNFILKTKNYIVF